MPNTYSLVDVAPVSGIKGVASDLFTMIPNAFSIDSVSLSDGVGGTFNPNPLLFINASPLQFRYTPPTTGVFSITPISTNGWTFDNSPYVYTGTPAYSWKCMQSKQNGTNSQPFLQTSFDSSVTAGNLIVVAVSLSSSFGVTVTDNKGNNYSQAVNPGNTAIFYTKVITGGSITVTVSVSPNTGIAVAMGEFFFPPGATLSLEATEHANTGSADGTVILTSIPVTMPDLVVMAINLAAAPISTSTPGAPMQNRQIVEGGGGDPGIIWQDVLSPMTSPVTSTAALGGGTYWTAVSAAFLAAMPTYEMLGPLHIAFGSSGLFTVVPTDTVNDTITIADNTGGVITPNSLPFSNSSFSQSFYYTPTQAGPATLTLTSASGHSIGLNPWVVGVFVNYTLTGVTGGYVGSGCPITITPVGTTTDTITFDDSGAGGTFSPNPLSLSGTSSPHTVTYTPSSVGSLGLSAVSSNGGTVTGSPLSFSASNVKVSPYVTKSGKIAMFMTPLNNGESNGNYPLANVTAVNSDPTIWMNTHQISIGDATWCDQSQNASQVGYLLKCGGVRNICASNAGQNYTSPTGIWNGDGGGAGHVVGVPTTAVGVTSYTITNPGSAMSNGVSNWNPGGSPGGFGALAVVTVVSGSVVSVVPKSPSPICIGGGYSTSFSANYNNAAITCNVNSYITSIPVINPGSGFTSPPTYTITDPTGSGAVAVPIMTGPFSTDSLTYSVGDGWLTTSAGIAIGSSGVLTNFVGKLEGPVGNVAGFTDKPTALFGGEYQGQVYTGNSYLFMYKNKLALASAFTISAGGGTLTFDSNYFPSGWTAGGTIHTNYASASDGTAAFEYGRYTLVYDDQHYQGNPATTAVNLPQMSFISQSVSGTTVTQLWDFLDTGSPAGYVENYIEVTSSDGKWHLNSVANFPTQPQMWLFAPNNTVDRSDPFAPDDQYIARLTGPSGTTVASIRFMEAFGGIGYNSLIDASDIPPNDNFAPATIAYPVTVITDIVAMRFLNTDPSSVTYSWSSTKLYGSAPWANSGSDSFGNYLDMTAGPLGVNDNGMILTCSDDQHGVIEFRTTSPHGLKTGQIIDLFTTSATTVPWSISGNVDLFAGGIGLAAFVTGPNTFAVIYGVSGGTGLQTVNSTTEIALTPPQVAINTIRPNGTGWIQYEFAASVMKGLPGSNLWLTIPVTASHGLITEIANRVIAHLGPTNGVIIEMGDEHWNFGVPFYLEFFYLLSLSNFSLYSASGTPFLTYAARGNNIQGATDAINSLLSADLFNVFRTSWSGAGRSLDKCIPAYGSWWTSDGTTGNVVSEINEFGLPSDNALLVVGPYLDFPLGQTSFNKACYNVGNVDVVNPGNWPCDAINDFSRHQMFYNNSYWGQWQRHHDNLTGNMRMANYEGSIERILDDTIGGPTSNSFIGTFDLGDFLTEDCMADPSFADYSYAYFLACQRGNPLTPNCGVSHGSYFNLYSDGFGGSNNQNNIWRLAKSPAMPTGPGLSNFYMTPQGGFNGSTSADHIWGYSKNNQAPGIEGLRTWNAATAQQIPTPPQQSLVRFLPGFGNRYGFIRGNR